MKTKLVLWGYNEKEEKVLIALQLKPKDNKVDIWTFPEVVATDEFARQLMGDWRNNKEIAFPDGNVHTERELSVTESLLPADLKVERGDIVQRAQTEWHFVVLSSKLNDVYKNELGDLQAKVATLTAYSADVWEDLKGFWGKVQDQVKERNLLREHADILRDETNVLFGKLKELRSALDDQFREMSKEHMDGFMLKLEDIEKNVADGVRLPAVFDQLKGLQRSFREIKLTREHRSKIWARLDGAFKKVKEKRFGPEANSESSATERLTRRFKGLMGAIEKMDRSIARDEDELNFQRKRINDTDGQLEAQLRQAKIGMTEERIRSKREKFDEMLKTKEDLDRRITSQKDKDAKRQEKTEMEAAKAAAKQKIANEIKNQAAAREDTGGKLEKAAGSIVSPEKVAAAVAGIAATGAIVEKTSETTTSETITSESSTGVAQEELEVTEAMFDKMKVTPKGTAEVKEEVSNKEAIVEQATVTKEADKVTENTVEAKEVIVEKVENITEGVSATVKAAAGAVVGAGAAAMSTIKGDDATGKKEEATTSADVKASGETVLEQASDVMEDITDSLSSTFKAGAAVLFGAGAAAVSKLSGEDASKLSGEEGVAEKGVNNVIDDASSISEIVDKVTGSDDV